MPIRSSFGSHLKYWTIFYSNTFSFLARQVTNPLQRKGVVTSKTNIYDSTKASRAKSWLKKNNIRTRNTYSTVQKKCKRNLHSTVNRRTSRKTSGERQVKPRKKIVNLRIVSYRNITKLIYLKWKLKEKKQKRNYKKKRKEAKRERLCPESNSRPPRHRAKALPLGHVQHTPGFVEMLLLKPSSLIKREFKDIFQKNDCSFDSEYQGLRS